MKQVVKSAIESAKQGDKIKAIEILKRVLNGDPDDVDAWLVLAAVIDDPNRKRQCLNRVLTLDPANKIAREELMEIDRMAMGGSFPFMPDPAPIKSPRSQPVPQSSEASSNEPIYQSTPTQQEPSQTKPQATPQPKPVSKSRAGKTLVFKFPLFWRILMYLSLIFFSCSGLVIAMQNIIISLPFLALALLMGLIVMIFSPKVEISEAGIRSSGIFNSSEVEWAEIVKMKSNAWRRRLELSKNNGDVINISTQVSGYPRIVEILRMRRPDLFGVAPNPYLQSSASTPISSNALLSSSDISSATPSFTGTRIFKKSFFAQYGIFLLMLPICMVGIWLLFANEDKFVGIGVGFIGLFFMAMSLFSYNQIKVESNKLITESFFGKKEYTARQIKDISMKTVRSRRGIATNFVKIQPMEGTPISLAGFPEGDEIIYSILRNWWETYKNR